ncbi:hypothetical protein F2P81_006437 [Scophthalmus maximus]|uniref:Microtubule-associated protein 1B/S N-terminal domain-containing protein n=1 Tax=Scophthalmus maximus TaxID=52904 RepID=A0A6A4T6P2_SCOMX|nr:hypothetical protein F2P81_006437 [Scophthalmus maximus]
MKEKRDPSFGLFARFDSSDTAFLGTDHSGQRGKGTVSPRLKTNQGLQSLFFIFVKEEILAQGGIRSWDVDLKCCDLDQQLQLFISRHSAHFSSEVRGCIGKSTRSHHNDTDAVQDADLNPDEEIGNNPVFPSNTADPHQKIRVRESFY